MSSAAPMQHAKTDVAKPAQQSSQLVAQSQQVGSSEAQHEFTDLRPQATTQRKLQDAAKRSPQSRQLKAFQQMAQNSTRSTQLKTVNAMTNVPALQRREDDEPLQAKGARESVQREAAAAPADAPKPNNTGLPDNLKSGIESLSGMSMDHVKVHFNSSQPAQLNAHAYAQGSEIHVAPGQEQHLPHEAWHVVQQAQGRVQPTKQMKAAVAVNDDVGLENEADVMGAKALGLGAVQMKQEWGTQEIPKASAGSLPGTVMQPKVKDAVVSKDTVARKKGERRSLVHGTKGRDLKKGDEIKVHDDKIFYSRMQTDEVKDTSYRNKDVSTAWNLLADSDREYIRFDTFRFSDIEDFLGEDEDDFEDTLYPFSGAEKIMTTDNPSLCEEMVTLWIAKRGRLEGYVNAALGVIPAVTKELASPFHDAARTIPKDVNATKESDYIEHLHDKYPSGNSQAINASYRPVTELLEKVLNLPVGGMMHVSIRKQPIESGGHAVGFAHSKSHYYIFDPNTGIAQLSTERLVAVIKLLFATEGRKGDWADLKLFYAVTIPDAQFKGLRKY